MNTNFSRRKFLKTSSMATGTLIAGQAPGSCSGKTRPDHIHDEPFPLFHGEGYDPDREIAGLLYSQIGYEKGYPVKIILRLPAKESVGSQAVCRLIPSSGRSEHESPFVYWGEIWGSHWWIAEFKTIEESGEWTVEVVDKGRPVFADKGLKIEKEILWNATVELAAADMLERRMPFTKVGAGWQDAGTLWVENCSQSAMVIALTELIELSSERIDAQLKERLYKQMTVGCDYLVMTRKKAGELGLGTGAMSHDLLGHEKDILPNDVVKAVIALARAARFLPSAYDEKKKTYQDAAGLSFDWLLKDAKPMGNWGLSLFQRGLPEGIVIPAGEWQTRQYVTLCWAALEMFEIGMKQGKELAVSFARTIMSMQIPEQQSESGFYGHFREYKSMSHSEKSWIHGITDNNHFGADMGGFYPNYLMPLIRMLKLWPGHEDAGEWKKTLHSFAYGYLIPACERNPFLLVPQGIFGKEGAVWFCGTFHGTNAIYGYTAALAFELAALFHEQKLKDIAYGNLQWLAGLNGGITRENLKACMVFSTDIPSGTALPASMMCGVGKRWAGSWFATRGVICNGFSTGKQFAYDTEPKQLNDGPFSLTDEDWIPHSAAWLTGLIRL